MPMMDITPPVNLLNSERAERVSYILLTGEAVDNAFDAGAHSVDIVITEHEISFTDDGCGVTRDRIDKLFKLGDHGHMATTKLGQFGVGITKQAINTGDVLEINSISADGHVRVRADWRAVMRHGLWQIEMPKWQPISVGTKTGTTITIESLRKSRTAKIDKIAADLAERFYPALAGIRRISLNGMPIRALSDPAMTDVVECVLTFPGGRTATVRAGMLVDEESPLFQVHLGLDHRVIRPRCTIGCDGYGGTSKFFARVALSGPWTPTRFKDDLADDVQSDELEAALAEIFEPILLKCQTATYSANIEDMTDRLNAKLPPVLQPARPRSRKAKGASSVGGRDGAGKNVVTDATYSSSGPVRAPKSRDQLIIDFDGRSRQDGIGRFEAGRPNHVHLARDDETIALFLAYRDKTISERALYAIAMMLFASGKGGDQLSLDLDFGLQVQQLMSLQNFA